MIDLASSYSAILQLMCGGPTCPCPASRTYIVRTCTYAVAFKMTSSKTSAALGTKRTRPPELSWWVGLGRREPEKSELRSRTGGRSRHTSGTTRTKYQRITTVKQPKDALPSIFFSPRSLRLVCRLCVSWFSFCYNLSPRQFVKIRSQSAT